MLNVTTELSNLTAVIICSCDCLKLNERILSQFDCCNAIPSSVPYRQCSMHNMLSVSKAFLTITCRSMLVQVVGNSFNENLTYIGHHWLKSTVSVK